MPEEWTMLRVRRSTAEALRLEMAAVERLACEGLSEAPLNDRAELTVDAWVKWQLELHYRHRQRAAQSTLRRRQNRQVAAAMRAARLRPDLVEEGGGPLGADCPPPGKAVYTPPA